MNEDNKVSKDSVQVNITYNEDEVRKALSHVLEHVVSLKWMIVTFVSIIVAVFFHGLWKGFGANTASIIGGFSCALCLYYWFYYERIIRYYLKFYKMRKGGQYTFFENEVNVIGEDMQATYKWTMYKKCYEVPTAFILEDENRFLYVFLKSCFDNEKDIEKLRGFIEGQIKTFKKIS